MLESVPAERGVSSRVAFPCDLQEARDATRMLRAFLTEQGMDESEVFQCELCLAEACNNAVQYAAGARDPIVAEAICRENVVELTVTDHTPGFELSAPSGPLSAEREHGRGLFIIQSMMDEVHYFRGRHRNTLVMRKTRTHQQHRSMDEATVASLDDARRQIESCQQTISGMARELCFRSESLAAIFRCCAELGRTSDIEGFAHRLLNDLLHLASADWFVLRLLPTGESRLITFAVSSPELRREPVSLERSTEPLSAELAAALTRREVELDCRHNAVPDEPLRAAGAQAAGLVQPLLFGDKLVGTLAVGRREADGPFSVLQAEMIRTFSEFMAVQVVNARHLEEQVHARLVAHELDIAHRIQRALLPRSLPQLANFGLAANWESARQVGGDFYDAIALSEHSVLLVVADVMGKGVPAAMFATITRSLLRALASRSHHPAKLLRRLNELLYEELSSVGMFITAQLVFVDLAERHLVAASAGHCPILIASGDQVRTLSVTGTPLGILPDATYRQQSAKLPAPASVLLYTDGLTEALNPAGEMFGHDRLADWLRQNFPRARSTEQLRDDLAADLARFRGGAALRDDQAFLLLSEKFSVLSAEPPAPPSVSEPAFHLTEFGPPASSAFSALSLPPTAIPHPQFA
ncbi:MAG TPA: SpoIIE family protein phosphatase [Opitutaceae bacterium]|nr:SpoIIE family protein phosphatase [Opitutaceae bacterium]